MVATVLAFNILNARTVEIRMSQCPKPIADYVNKAVKGLSVDDHVILNFDKAGTYEIDGTIHIECSTTIKGVGSDSTKVIIREGRFANGKSKMLDDCFFGINAGEAISGTTDDRIQFEMRDITFETAPHKGIWWENNEKLLVKVYDACELTVENVAYHTRDATITCLDLRDCSNVLVQNCTFENYNNTITGGCLWSRGVQRNVVIRDNVFKKYGNDEALAMWGSNHDYVSEMKNITVENNEFVYDNKTDSKTEYPIHVFISFIHSEDEDIKYECIIDSVFFRNNKITMNADYTCNMALVFDKLARIGHFEISGNEFVNTAKCSSVQGYHTDISIRAGGIAEAPIIVRDNYVRSDFQVINDGGSGAYTFAGVANTSVLFKGNVIDSKHPVALLWGHGGDIDVKLERNTASTLGNTAILSDYTFINKARIEATDNVLNGDTRIYCNNIAELEIVYNNNTLNCNDYLLLIQEGAPKTSVIFNGNTINALTGKGTMYANYSGAPCHFSNIQVKNNIFRGVRKSDIENAFSKARTKSINNNIYQ